jgi:hypothetical protein
MLDKDYIAAKTAAEELDDILADKVPGLIGIGLVKENNSYIIKVCVEKDCPTNDIPHQHKGYPVLSVIGNRIRFA